MGDIRFGFVRHPKQKELMQKMIREVLCGYSGKPDTKDYRALELEYLSLLEIEQPALESFPDLLRTLSLKGMRDILDSSKLWEVERPGLVLSYDLGQPGDPVEGVKEYCRSRARHIEEVLSSAPAALEINDLRELFSGILQHEQDGELVLATNLSRIGLLWPSVYSSDSRRLWEGQEPDEQKVMEQILGFAPPYYQKEICMP